MGDCSSPPASSDGTARCTGATPTGGTRSTACSSASTSPPENPTAAVRRDVVAHSLFGVDLTLTAVRLAELRLWLALVAEQDEVELARIAPLPNLDGHVRQGDALLDPLALARALSGAGAPNAPGAQVERLTTARRALF